MLGIRHHLSDERHHKGHLAVSSLKLNPVIPARRNDASGQIAPELRRQRAKGLQKGEAKGYGLQRLDPDRI